MAFVPPRCPRCPLPESGPAPCNYQRRGSFRRRCDLRLVQRYQCQRCKRYFSDQTFRLDYRHRRPELNEPIYRALISKVTLRQVARTLGCKSELVARRLVLFGAQARRMHQRLLRQATTRALLAEHPKGLGRFQLDELETFEHNRLLKPLTAPVLIHEHSLFVLDLRVASLPCRGRLSPRNQEKKRALESAHGKRRNGSSPAVRACLTSLGQLLQRAPDRAELVFDRKSSYPGLVRSVLGRTFATTTISSRAPRDYGCALFEINHTLAGLRDGLSRLVRRNWATTKRAERLELHLWVWALWRNCVRSVTNKLRRLTPAMSLGVLGRKLRLADLIRIDERYAQG